MKLKNVKLETRVQVKDGTSFAGELGTIVAYGDEFISVTLDSCEYSSSNHFTLNELRRVK